MDAALREETEIDRMVAPWLGGDDPIFGFRTALSLSDFFDHETLSGMKPTDDGTLDILYGCGAALAGWDGLLIYLDIPKNEIQFRARAGSICNLGKREPEAPKKMSSWSTPSAKKTLLGRKAKRYGKGWIILPVTDSDPDPGLSPVPGAGNGSASTSRLFPLTCRIMHGLSR